LNFCFSDQRRTKGEKLKEGERRKRMGGRFWMLLQVKRTKSPELIMWPKSWEKMTKP
jgi:hypothetical protein